MRALAPLAALALCVAPSLLAADDEPRPKLEAWPELSRAEERSAKAELARVRQARTPEMADEGHAALVEIGAGAAPLVLPVLGKERDEDALERLAAVLDDLTDERHTRLLGAEFEHDDGVVRTYCLLRVARFPDPGLLAGAEAALERMDGLEEREHRDYDEHEHWAAALAATSAGSTAGLGRLVERAVEDWAEEGEAMRLALAGAKGAEATAAVAELLDGAARRELVAGLRVIAACGSRDEAVPVVRPHLDSSDNSIRIAAINALRGIVDGDPPLERLSVFDAIEHANRWKARL